MGEEHTAFWPFAQCPKGQGSPVAEPRQGASYPGIHEKQTPSADFEASRQDDERGRCPTEAALRP